MTSQDTDILKCKTSYYTTRLVLNLTGLVPYHFWKRMYVFMTLNVDLRSCLKSKKGILNLQRVTVVSFITMSPSELKTSDSENY